MPFLMNKNRIALCFSFNKYGSIDFIEINNKDLLPEMLKDGNIVYLHKWLRSRCIDLSRRNARILLEQLKINNNSIDPVMYNKGTSLIDTFWIKYNESEAFNDNNLYIKAFDTKIFDIALNGALQSLPLGINTELTNIGSFNKAWSKKGNNWWLYKLGSKKHIYAELFTYYLGKSLGMNMAVYKPLSDQNLITSLNFTDESISLEHYFSFKYAFNDTSYNESTVYHNMKSIGLHHSYLDILLLDGIVCNPDRHEFNLGVLKNTNTGNLVSLAPNYDNNLALGAESNLTLYLLREYLDTFGLPEHQIKYINTLSQDLMLSIDTQVKTETGFTDLDTTDIFNYFNQVIIALKSYQSC
ncbi:hypothetical protein EDC18_10512 [Natranaerovirga pectinivora]|uniref:HipA-like protein n=1 Tax=Natranaerovirga pectinivora TaxID=682400 RepID=A0A4R3MK06_9FIRM|nr:hypothetical protein [Natranaerovirga pectinivora]TCT14531.1 hypothetical protein EDC18_10512 [Natranaerovirga pectinivora]